jgi:hypothetical protein
MMKSTLGLVNKYQYISILTTLARMKRYTEHPVFGQKKTKKEIDHHT